MSLTYRRTRTMSKASKLAKQKRAATTRRPRAHRRGHRNPLKGGEVPLEFAPTEIPLVIDMLIGLGHLMRGFIGSSRIKASECICKGECLCHTGLQIAGQPCPPDCKHYGDHFDGCHRCDPECQPPEKIQ